MKPIASLPATVSRGLRGVFCDVDDTLSWEGKLVPEAFLALAALQAAGLRVIPVTGRPGGWVDHLARMWPVDGAVGENGGLWFYLDDAGKMVRRFVQDADTRRKNRERLNDLGAHIVARIPGSGIASDQPYRELDLAIDFCEDVAPLGDAAIDAIVTEFKAVGAQAKVSSIHVNGWYGDFDKIVGCRQLVKERWDVDLERDKGEWAFVGDSPNDEPSFAYFPVSVGVSNVLRFTDRLTHKPAFVTKTPGGHGFAEFAQLVLEARSA